MSSEVEKIRDRLDSGETNNVCKTVKGTARWCGTNQPKHRISYRKEGNYPKPDTAGLWGKH